MQMANVLNILVENSARLALGAEPGAAGSGAIPARDLQRVLARCHADSAASCLALSDSFGVRGNGEPF